MIRARYGVIALLLSANLASAQVSQSNPPSNTVVGQPGGGTGAAPAIPFGALAAQLPLQQSSENGDYTVQTSDCFKRITFSSTSPALYTFPVASGFPANCDILVSNTGSYTGSGSARGLLLSVRGVSFPSQGNVLYPGQTTEFTVAGGTWVEVGYQWRKRWHPQEAPTFFVDCLRGSDNIADGLGPGTGANLTLVKGYERLSIFVDYSNGLQPTLSSTGSCRAGDGIHMAGPLVGTTGNGAMKWNGNGTTTVNANGGISCLSLFDGAIIEVINVRCVSADSTGCWSVATHSVLFFITTASSCDPGAGQGFVATGGGSKIEFVNVGLTFGAAGSRSPVSLFSVSDGGAIVFDAAETISFAGNIAFSEADVVAYGLSLVALSSVTFNLNAHTITGTRFACQQWSVIRGTGGAPNAFLPGDANGKAGADCLTP